jgi:hypothetical protein
VKLLATLTDRFIVHEAVAVEVMALVTIIIRSGVVQVIDVPVLQDGRRDVVTILITPSTQMSISPVDGPELELTQTDRDAVAELAAGAAGATAAVEEPDGADASSAFVDFDLYVTTTAAAAAPSRVPDPEP